uniref:isochorismatase family protein n=1 Tax=Stutzerimonas balearica TaxID=74829 RepID=UPI0028AF242C
MLDLRRTALLVIDMQRDFCAPGGYADQAGLNIDRLRAPIPVIARLLAHARALGLLVVHTREGHRPDLTDLPAAKRQAEAEHAALAILRLSHKHAGELMLVMLGPLTNLALALKLDPTLPQRIKRIVVMGGAVTCHGN